MVDSNTDVNSFSSHHKPLCESFLISIHLKFYILIIAIKKNVNWNRFQIQNIVVIV